jgi:glutaredoxin
MTCKYFDSGWCYAPEDVEHNSKNGSCIDPLSCPYRKENKTLMTKKDLECEIQELELELEQKGAGMRNLIDILSRKQQKLREMNDAQKLQEKNWTNITGTPVFVGDSENIIVVDGVKYQRIVEKPKPQTLFEIIREWCDDDDQPTCEELVNKIEREWLPNEGCHELNSNDYCEGWNDCIEHLKENLK